MYTFKLVDGDIAVRGDGNIQKISGAERIEQELACWILEPLGSDAMYPRFGSKLSESIGSPALDEYLLDIRAEVTRVVNNYIAYQQRQVDKYRSGSEQDFIDAWNDDDLISVVNGIDISVLADTVQVTVTLTTAGGRSVRVSQVL